MFFQQHRSQVLREDFTTVQFYISKQTMMFIIVTHLLRVQNPLSTKFKGMTWI